MALINVSIYSKYIVLYMIAAGIRQGFMIEINLW